MKATPSGIPDAQWDALIELEAAVIAAARLCVARHDVCAATDSDQTSHLRRTRSANCCTRRRSTQPMKRPCTLCRKRSKSKW